MLISDKQFVLIEFLVAKNRRIELPCIAFTSLQSIQKGLMNVKRMSRSVGAFFVFEKSQLNTFWMKQTGISLDVLFVNELGIINQIVKGEPYSLSPIGGLIPSKYVVEVVSGFVEKYNVLKGMRIKVSPLKKKEIG